jgi:hypothetical protein
MKTNTSNGYIGLVGESPQPIAMAQLKKGTGKKRVRKISAQELNHLMVEV